jgi:DNA-binding GntR family transcriptional regulator
VTAEQLARLDLDFHEILVRAAKHKRLLAVWLTLCSQIRLLMVQHNLVEKESRPATVQAHGELLQAIRARDENRAIALTERHMRSYTDYSIALFGARPGRKDW